MKKNKWMFIICFVVVVIFIVFMLIITTDKEDSIPNNLIAKCNRTGVLSNMRTEMSIEIYRDTKPLRIVNKSKNVINSNMSNIIDSSSLNKLATIYKESQDKQIAQKFGQDYKYVESNVEQKDNYIETTIIYNINEESYNDMISAFSYDFYNASNEDVVNYFREDGLDCEIY